MTFQQQLKYKFSQFSIVEKVIVINVICFAIPLLLNTFLFLFKVPSNSLTAWVELSSNPTTFLSRPWTFITYGFFHSGFFHLFWNMILLYFSGRTLVNLFPKEKFMSIYFLGIFCGAVLFVVSYWLFPVFEGTQPALIGASAGVMAVLIFVCTYMPNLEVSFFFFLRLKLRYLGIALVVLDLLQIPSSNAGGHIAHLGGAILGFFYAYQLKKGIDIGTPFKNFLSFKFFSSESKVKKRKPKNPSKSNTTSYSQEEQVKIDTILDKISKSGYDSLSKEEKNFLFQAGKK